MRRGVLVGHCLLALAAAVKFGSHLADWRAPVHQHKRTRGETRGCISVRQENKRRDKDTEQEKERETEIYLEDLDGKATASR